MPQQHQHVHLKLGWAQQAQAKVKKELSPNFLMIYRELVAVEKGQSRRTAEEVYHAIKGLVAENWSDVLHCTLANIKALMSSDYGKEKRAAAGKQVKEAKGGGKGATKGKNGGRGAAKEGRAQPTAPPAPELEDPGDETDEEDDSLRDAQAVKQYFTW